VRRVVLALRRRCVAVFVCIRLLVGRWALIICPREILLAFT